MMDTRHDPPVGQAASAPRSVLRRWGRRLLGACALLLAAALLLRHNPLDYLFDAGPVAYYQARMAYLYGSEAQRAQLEALLDDQKVTQHEYSAVVFPVFAHTVPDNTSLFPSTEFNKSADILRGELVAAIQRHHR